MSRSQGTVLIQRRIDSPLSYGQQADQRMRRAGTLRKKPLLPMIAELRGKQSDISSSTLPEDSIKLLDGAATEFWDLVRFLSSRTWQNGTRAHG